MAKKETVEVDVTVYLTKPATDLQARFPGWIEENVGYDPTSAKTKREAFEEGVRLSTATRMIFQASPENRAANEARRLANLAEAEEVAAAPKKAKAAKPEAVVVEPVKAKGKKKAKAAPEPEPEEDEEEEETPKPTPKKAAKKAKGTKRRGSPAEDEDEEEAPF